MLPKSLSTSSLDIFNCKKSDIWFADGNIILLAEFTIFKVHRGQLERHSDVFAGLFSIPPPPDQVLVDGCSWVQVFDDPADIYHWIKAIYDGLYFMPPSPDDFVAIAAIVRMSHKYISSDSLREHCLERLSMDWPSTLFRWDEREGAATRPRGHYEPRQHYTHPIHVILFAIQSNVPEILPAAFYDLSRYGPSKIVQGTLSLKQPGPFDQPQTTVILHHDLVHTILKGRETAQQHLAAFITNKTQNRAPVKRCRYSNSNRGCTEGFNKLAFSVMRSVNGVSSGRDGDPLYTLITVLDDLRDPDIRISELDICDACSECFSNTVMREREDIWRSIPTWFGL